MTDAEILEMTKANLEIIQQNKTQDIFLLQLIGAARQMITREGISLEDTLEDTNLIVMYAAYLYRKRAEDNPVMPRMLRYALNNRVLSQVAKGAEDV